MQQRRDDEIAPGTEMLLGQLGEALCDQRERVLVAL
jgi:hypothetical protein